MSEGGWIAESGPIKTGSFNFKPLWTIWNYRFCFIFYTYIGVECFEEILKKVKEGLTGVEKQPENTEKYSSLDKGSV